MPRGHRPVDKGGNPETLRQVGVKRFRRIRLRRALAFAALTTVVGAAGVAYAAQIPDSHGVIHACYQSRTGFLRVTGPGKPPGCTEKEKPLSWSAAGAHGATGATGPTGPTGAAGPQWVATGLVKPDGTVVVESADPGVDVTVSRDSQGQYSFAVTGAGNGCPLPALTPYAASFDVSFVGGTCGGGDIDTTVFTSDEGDHYWSFLVVGTSTATDSVALPTP